MTFGKRMTWMRSISVVAGLLCAGCSSTVVTHRTTAHTEFLTFTETTHTSLSVHGGFIEGGTAIKARIELKEKKENSFRFEVQQGAEKKP